MCPIPLRLPSPDAEIQRLSPSNREIRHYVPVALTGLAKPTVKAVEGKNAYRAKDTRQETRAMTILFNTEYVCAVPHK
jgi:hypothetical protein